METVYLTLTEDYVSHWSWWEGARELMQNAIDRGEGNYSIDFFSDKIVIKSLGAEIPVNALLMGKSSKRDDPDTIGCFGEGLKVGMLVLLREGADILIQNGADVWKPVIQYNDIFDENTLAVRIHTNRHPYNKDVKITISNIPRDIIEMIQNKYAPALGLEVAIENDLGKAYVKPDVFDIEWGVPDHSYSNVYVNGLFIARVEGKGSYKFDYDFKPSVLTLDRDRNTVGTWEFEYETSRLLSESDDVEFLARLALEDYQDLSKFTERRRHNTGRSYFATRMDSEQDILTETATELFKNKHGDKAFPISQDWTSSRQRVVTESVIKSGYTPVFVSNSLFKMIEKSYKVDEKIESILVFQPLPWLEAFLNKHKRRLDAKPRRELERTIALLKVAKGE